MLATVGTCSSPYTVVDTVATCEAAALILSLADTIAGGSTTPDNPYGCYYKVGGYIEAGNQLWFNPYGGMTDDDTDRVSLCKLTPITPTPTAAPTNIGDTKFPTAAPTCGFDSGLCSGLTQDTDDNFDWTLTSEGTPTGNTGSDTGRDKQLVVIGNSKALNAREKG
jgi:hypothetical protein